MTWAAIAAAATLVAAGALTVMPGRTTRSA